MNRFHPLRSRPYLPNYLLETLLLAGVSFITCPAWSMPVELVPYSAIDLVSDRTEVARDIDTAAASSQQSALNSASASNSQSPPPLWLSVVRTFGEASVEPLSALRFEFTSQAHVKANSQRPTPDLRSAERCSAKRSRRSQLPVPNPSPPIDLDPKLIESSPVLQRWLKRVPDVLTDIKHDPSFRTRLRLGYTQFPSSNQASGLNVGIDDVFMGRSRLTFSADYQTAFNGMRKGWGGDFRYYLRPLGRVINIAPVVGYRNLETTRYSTDGVHLGLRLLLVPSRTGAADLALTQSWVAPGNENEVGLTTLSFGYALTQHLRLSTDIQKQNSRFRSDNRLSIGLEWMF